MSCPATPCIGKSGAYDVISHRHNTCMWSNQRVTRLSPSRRALHAAKLYRGDLRTSSKLQKSSANLTLRSSAHR